MAKRWVRGLLGTQRDREEGGGGAARDLAVLSEEWPLGQFPRDRFLNGEEVARVDMNDSDAERGSEEDVSDGEGAMSADDYEAPEVRACGPQKQGACVLTLAPTGVQNASMALALAYRFPCGGALVRIQYPRMSKICR